MNMYDNEFHHRMKEELQRDAQRMLGDSAPLIAVLRSEFARRRRQRALVRNSSAAAAVIAVGLIVTDLSLRQRIESVPPQTAADNRNMIPVADVQQEWSSAEIAAGLPEESTEPGRARVVAIAILIPQAADDGELQLVPAWYVPGQIEEIDVRDLTPAERSAVSQLLGPEFDSTADEII
jgi:hypothetical protein